MYSNPVLYSTSAYGQETDAFKVLQKCTSHWGDSECIMDAGCGIGNVTKHLLSTIPTICKVIGVDILPDMINYANTFNSDPKISYHVADLQDKSTFRDDWIGSFDKVFSFTTLHWITDHAKVFQNFNSCLKLNGEVIANFPYEFPRWNKAFNGVMEGKWRSYLSDFRTTLINVENIGELNNQSWQTSGDPIKEYKILVEEQGFRVEKIESVLPGSFLCSMDQLERMLLSICPQLAMIPEEMHVDFVKDFIAVFNPPVDKDNMVHADDGAKHIFLHAIKC